MKEEISYVQVTLVLEQGQLCATLDGWPVISVSAPTNVHTCCLAPGGP